MALQVTSVPRQGSRRKGFAPKCAENRCSTEPRRLFSRTPFRAVGHPFRSPQRHAGVPSRPAAHRPLPAPERGRTFALADRGRRFSSVPSGVTKRCTRGIRAAGDSRWCIPAHSLFQVISGTNDRSSASKSVVVARERFDSPKLKDRSCLISVSAQFCVLGRRMCQG
jgi:hypothetical protein